MPSGFRTRSPLRGRSSCVSPKRGAEVDFGQDAERQVRHIARTRKLGLFSMDRGISQTWAWVLQGLAHKRSSPGVGCPLNLLDTIISNSEGAPEAFYCTGPNGVVRQVIGDEEGHISISKAASLLRPTNRGCTEVMKETCVAIAFSSTGDAVPMAAQDFAKLLGGQAALPTGTESLVRMVPTKRTNSEPLLSVQYAYSLEVASGKALHRTFRLAMVKDRQQRLVCKSITINKRLKREGQRVVEWIEAFSRARVLQLVLEFVDDAAGEMWLVRSSECKITPTHQPYNLLKRSPSPKQSKVARLQASKGVANELSVLRFGHPLGETARDDSNGYSTTTSMKLENDSPISATSRRPHTAASSNAGVEQLGARGSLGSLDVEEWGLDTIGSPTKALDSHRPKTSCMGQGGRMDKLTKVGKQEVATLPQFRGFMGPWEQNSTTVARTPAMGRVLGSSQLGNLCRGDFCDVVLPGEVEQRDNFERKETGNSSGILASEGSGDVEGETNSLRQRLLRFSEAALEDYGVMEEPQMQPREVTPSFHKKKRRRAEEQGRNRVRGHEIREWNEKGETDGGQNIPMSWIIRGRQERHLVEKQLRRYRRGDSSEYIDNLEGLGESSVSVGATYPANYYQSARVCQSCFRVYTMTEDARTRAIAKIIAGAGERCWGSNRRKRARAGKTAEPCHTADPVQWAVEGLNGGLGSYRETVRETGEVEIGVNHEFRRKHKLGSGLERDGGWMTEGISHESQALARAQMAINGLTTRDICELRSFVTPPAAVNMVVAALMIVLTGDGEPSPASWTTAKRYMADIDKVHAGIASLHPASLRASQARKLEEYAKNPAFRPEFVARVSLPASKLCGWILGVLEANRWQTGRGHTRISILDTKTSLGVEDFGSGGEGIPMEKSISPLGIPLGRKSPPLLRAHHQISGPREVAAKPTEMSRARIFPSVRDRGASQAGGQQVGLTLARRREKNLRQEKLVSRLADPDALPPDPAGFEQHTFICEDRVTRIPYAVFGTAKPSAHTVSFVVVHDFFDTLEKTFLLFKPLVLQHPGCQVLCFNIPGQAGTSCPPESECVLTNVWVADRLNELMQHVNNMGEMLLAGRPFHLVGIGNGASVAAAFACQHDRLPCWMSTLRTLVCINGFAKVDTQLTAVLHSTLGAFRCFPPERPDLPITFWSRFIFGADYLRSVGVDLALNIYCAVSNPLGVEGMSRIIQGALKHRDLQKDLQSMKLPLVLVQSTENLLISAANVDPFLEGRKPYHLWSHELQQHLEPWEGKTCLGSRGEKALAESISIGQRGAFVLWVKGGHEVRQERKRVVTDILGLLVAPEGQPEGYFIQGIPASPPVTQQKVLGGGMGTRIGTRGKVRFPSKNRTEGNGGSLGLGLETVEGTRSNNDPVHRDASTAEDGQEIIFYADGSELVDQELKEGHDLDPKGSGADIGLRGELNITTGRDAWVSVPRTGAMTLGNTDILPRNGPSEGGEGVEVGGLWPSRDKRQHQHGSLRLIQKENPVPKLPQRVEGPTTFATRRLPYHVIRNKRRPRATTAPSLMVSPTKRGNRTGGFSCHNDQPLQDSSNPTPESTVIHLPHEHDESKLNATTRPHTALDYAVADFDAALLEHRRQRGRGTSVLPKLDLEEMDWKFDTIVLKGVPSRQSAEEGESFVRLEPPEALPKAKAGVDVSVDPNIYLADREQADEEISGKSSEAGAHIFSIGVSSAEQQNDGKRKSFSAVGSPPLGDMGSLTLQSNELSNSPLGCESHCLLENSSELFPKQSTESRKFATQPGSGQGVSNAPLPGSLDQSKTQEPSPELKLSIVGGERGLEEGTVPESFVPLVEGGSGWALVGSSLTDKCITDSQHPTQFPLAVDPALASMKAIEIMSTPEQRFARDWMASTAGERVSDPLCAATVEENLGARVGTLEAQLNNNILMQGKTQLEPLDKNGKLHIDEEQGLEELERKGELNRLQGGAEFEECNEVIVEATAVLPYGVGKEEGLGGSGTLTIEDGNIGDSEGYEGQAAEENSLLGDGHTSPLDPKLAQVLVTVSKVAVPTNVPIRGMRPQQYKAGEDLPVAISRPSEDLSVDNVIAEMEEKARRAKEVGVAKLEDYMAMEKQQEAREVQRVAILLEYKLEEHDRLIMEKMALKIQRLVRGILGRARVRNLQDGASKVAKKEWVATKIQSLSRMHSTRAKVARIRKLQQEERVVGGKARDIQRVFRGFIGRREYHIRLRDFNIRKLQRVGRGFLGRRVALRKIRQLERIAARASAATSIQSLWRGKIEREEYFKTRSSSIASREIQRVFRGHLGRRAAKRRRDWEAATPGPERLKLGLKMIEDTKITFERQQGEIAALHRAQEKAEARISSIHHQLKMSESELGVLESELAQVDHLERDLVELTHERDLLQRAITGAVGLPRTGSTPPPDDEVIPPALTSEKALKMKTDAYALEMQIQVKRAEREQRRQQLSAEFTSTFAEVEDKKCQLTRLSLAVEDIECTRLRKAREFSIMQKNLMELLSQQKRELDNVREKGAQLETAAATSAAAAAATAQRARDHEAQSASMFTQTEELMKFQFMSMSLSYFSSLNMMKQMRNINADTTTSAIVGSADAAAAAAAASAAANVPSLKNAGILLNGSDIRTSLVFRKQEIKEVRAEMKEAEDSQQCPFPTDIKLWSVEDVCRWLDTLQLGEYREAFREGRVDGNFLVELRESDLMDSIGMRHKLHLRKLLLARKKLTPLSAEEISKKNGVLREEAADRDRAGLPSLEGVFSQARHGKRSRLEKSLNLGFNIEEEDENGNTLLVVATQQSQMAVIEFLIKRGANVNHCNAAGNTPLHYAMTYDPSGNIGEFLINNGADDTLENNVGMTPC